jgi:hypothetical protein
MPLRAISTPYFLMPYLQPLQNGERPNFWGGCKKLGSSQRGTMKFCMLTHLQRWTSFNQSILMRNQKYECSDRFKVNVYILFSGDNSRTFTLPQMKCGTVKDYGHAYKFYLNYDFVWRSSYVCWWCEIWGYVGPNAEPLPVELLNNASQVGRLVQSTTSYVLPAASPDCLLFSSIPLCYVKQ